MTAADAAEDPFATAGIRDRVLAAWQASPARFREDANAEEELALGAYRDRVLVELAQNAADAAARAGPTAGRLLLRLIEDDASPTAGRLVAANTGAALDAAGVQALATLRASGKREGDTVGRFGVGFSAVLAVTDEPAVLSRTGGVQFSRRRTAELVRAAASGSTGLADELARRGGHVPVLRLPFAIGPSTDARRTGPPEGYDTVVVLRLRDADAARAVHDLLDVLDDGLLLALPALAEVRIELPDRPPRVLRDVAERWRVLRRVGTFDDALLADRPTEERSQREWAVTWALPRDPDTLPPAVVHAPTPSDEPLNWPALLVATFPLDSSRRHVAPGPATDALVAAAAQAYADLLAELAAEPLPGSDPRVREPWRLVPTGLPVGALDGAVRAALLGRLPAVPMLRSAENSALALRPRDAVALEAPAGADPDAVDALAGVVAGLVTAPRAATAAFDLLGVRRLPLADVVDQVPPPSDDAGWHRLYRGLVGLAADATAREALGGLGVPLADGRVVRGARGLVLPAGSPGVATALATLGARAVRPEIAADETSRRLLERLGALEVTGRQALELPAVAAAVADVADTEADDEVDDDSDERAQRAAAVLTLVAAAIEDGGLEPGDLPWLGDLPLPDAEGDLVPAAALALPRSPAARLLDPEAIGTVDEGVVRRWGRAVLGAVGVLDGLAVVRAADVPLDGAPEEPLEDALDGVADWLDHLAGMAEAAFGSALGAVAAEVVGIRDLDAVRDEAWPAALELVAGEPALRAAVVTPVRLVAPTGASASGSSYTAWWLREQLAAGGAWADPDATDGTPGLAALLPPAPPALSALDPAMRAALGGVRDPAELDQPAVIDILDGLADPAVELDAATALRVWAVLGELVLARRPDVAGEPAPERVRVLAGTGTQVVEAERACVAGDPMHVQRADLGPFVVAPTDDAAAALADVLDLPLAADLAAGAVTEAGAAAGRTTTVPTPARAVLPAAPPQWCEHELLLVDGAEVDWWVDRDGLVHASTLDGLARGLAWAAGAWQRRPALAEVLVDPAELPRVLIDEAFSPVDVD